MDSTAKKTAMNEVSQKTHDAFQAGAGFSMGESYTALTVMCLGLVILIALYVVYCIAKGLGDDAIKMKDAPMLILRAVILIIIVGLFFTF